MLDGILGVRGGGGGGGEDGVQYACLALLTCNNMLDDILGVGGGGGTSHYRQHVYFHAIPICSVLQV